MTPPRTLLSLLLSAAALASPADLGAQAQAAYDTKEYGRCSTLMLEAAKGATARARPQYLYSAACCQALAGQGDTALATLEQAIDAGFDDSVHMAADPDLKVLVGSARFKTLLAKARIKNEAENKAHHPVLKRELLQMRDLDQAARQKAMAGDPKGLAAMTELDRKHAERLKQIIKKVGWPGRRAVGKDAAHAAWLLVQHADHDLPFQKLGLEKLEAAVKEGDAQAQEVAYLTDRVAVAEGRPQVYGTQFTGGPDPQPRPIADEAHLDERREAVGLGTMEEYRQQMTSVYAGAAAPAADAGR